MRNFQFFLASDDFPRAHAQPSRIQIHFCRKRNKLRNDSRRKTTTSTHCRMGEIEIEIKIDLFAFDLAAIGQQPKATSLQLSCAAFWTFCRQSNALRLWFRVIKMFIAWNFRNSFACKCNRMSWHCRNPNSKQTKRHRKLNDSVVDDLQQFSTSLSSHLKITFSLCFCYLWPVWFMHENYRIQIFRNHNLNDVDFVLAIFSFTFLNSSTLLGYRFRFQAIQNMCLAAKENRFRLW